jgi:hypothetical protein
VPKRITAGQAAAHVIGATMKKLLISLCALGLSACAHGPTVEEPTSHFVLSSTGASYSVTIRPSGLTGTDYQVSRYSDAFRGSIKEKILDAEVENGKVNGNLGSAPFSCSIETEGDATHVRGIYAGHLTDFRASPQMIAGQAGQCSYQLQRSGTEYAGYSSCSGTEQRATHVTVPDEFTNHPDIFLATELMMMLAR